LPETPQIRWLQGVAKVTVRHNGSLLAAPGVALDLIRPFRAQRRTAGALANPVGGRLNWRMLLNRKQARPRRPMVFVSLLLAACCGVVHAQAKPDAAAAIKHSIESRFTGAHVLDVQPSAIPGLFEVFMGDQIVYADASGDYLVMGPMMDTQTHENMTEARLNDHGRIDFKSLPLERAIKVVKGNGNRKIAVFSDPDCPFCQQLEKTLLSVTDITMYVFLFPIASLHPQAPAKAHAIWCAKDRTAAWNTWMHEKKLPPTGTACSGDPIDALQKLGDTLHINSTPTIFFADGRRVAGALPAADLEKQLATSAAKAAAATPHG
jgi:thiol:disulfide interchange protein DsbC